LTQQFFDSALQISATPPSGIANSARHRRLTGDFAACYPECTLRAKRKIAAWDDDFLASFIVA